MKYKTLSWEELASFYKDKTGQSAMIRTMDAIYDWAIKQKEIIVNKDTSLSLNLK